VRGGRPETRTTDASASAVGRVSAMSILGLVVTILLGQGSSTVGTSSAESSANRTRLACEGIGTLITAREVSSLLLELVHGDSGERGGGVVLCLVLVHLMNGHSSVDDRGLNGLLLNYRLDVFMDVVVDVLASNGWIGRRGVLGISDSTSILELGLLSCETLLDVLIVAVLQVTSLNAGHLVVMLLWENLAVLDRLNGGVVVILVNLSVNSCGDILMLGACDVLLSDSRVDGLVDCGIMLSILVEEASNCCLCLVHLGDSIDFLEFWCRESWRE